MVTLRGWLNALSFDWASGTIVLQYVDEDDYINGNPTVKAQQIQSTDIILDRQFSDGFGGLDAPHIIASDLKHVYIIGQYDGSSWMERVSKDVLRYLDPKVTIPIIGG